MRYNRIKTCDTQNCEGLCVSLWLQGCPHKCEGCWNEETWDYNGGILFTEREVEYILDQLSYNQDLAILGGEPLIKRNIEPLTELCKTVKNFNPNIKIWLWTGYCFEELTDEEKDAIIAKFEGVVKACGGNVEKVDKWGIKKLVYPINYKTEGYYVLMAFESEVTAVAELKRVAGITDGVMRRLITKA